MPLQCFILEDEIDHYPRNQIKEVLESAGHDLTIATSRKDAESKYKGGYDLLLLDHDLEGHYESSEHPNTAYQFLKRLLQDGWTDKKKPTIILHSHNVDGRKNMRLLLQDYGLVAQEFRFDENYVKELKRVYGK